MTNNTSFHKILHLDINRNAKSWQAVKRNDWYVKFSVYRTNILLVFTSSITQQTIIRFFIDEDEACEFINSMVEKDASKIIEQM